MTEVENAPVAAELDKNSDGHHAADTVGHAEDSVGHAADNVGHAADSVGHAADSDGHGADTVGKIIKQIEYYFGDMNLMRDKFMKEKMQEDDGWIDIETLLKFNRLRQITDSSSLICEAVKKSTSGLLEVNEGGDKIRRSPLKPLPGDSKERRVEISDRTIYANVFPDGVTLDELSAFFEKYGPIENIHMRRDFTTKQFKGSVFAVFVKRDDAKKFIDEEQTKFRDVALEVKSFKADHLKFKAENKKKRGAAEKAKEKSNDEPKPSTDEELEEKVKQEMAKNSVLHLKGLDPQTSIEQIKKYFHSFGAVGFVDVDRNATEGYVRMKDADSAGPTLEKALAADNGKVVIKNAEIELRVVTGDEEFQYWKKMFRAIEVRRLSGDNKNKKGGKSQRGGGGGRKFRGGRGGRRQDRNDRSDRKRRHDDAVEGPASKVSKRARD